MDMHSVTSSNIEEIGYEKGILRVRFKNGAEYEYKDVPIEVFENLLHAESVGKTFHQTIKNKYEYTRWL